MAAPWQVSGTTDIAPHSPVADWRCVAEGEGYGNYYDPISQQYATVTRTTPKTARTADGRIVDVPAGKLALEPWSLHKAGGVGHAAIIEEARTNYLLNSYGAANDGSRWAPLNNVAPALSSAIVGGLYSDTAQRLYGSFVSSGADGPLFGVSSAGTFAASDNATGTIYVKGTSDSPLMLRVRVLAADGVTQVGTKDMLISPTSSWQRVASSYLNLPLNTSRCELYLRFLHGLDAVDITFDAVQLEKGSFATSYIPTTTAAVTRGSEKVLVDATGWNPASTTIVAVANNTGTYGTHLLGWNTSTSNDQRLYAPYGQMRSYRSVSGAISTRTLLPSTLETIGPLVYAATLPVGGYSNIYANGVPTQQPPPALTLPAFDPPPPTAGIGCIGVVSYVQGAPIIGRLIVYGSILTDEQLAAADMTTNLLAGIEGVAAPALAADWRVVPTGLGYGNYYDSVTQQWASVARSTPKTAQIAPDRIVDVPAGQLAVVPWSLHKAGGTGYAAVIEEARTNYVLNSYFAADADSDGRADGVSSTADTAFSRISSSVYGYEQRIASLLAGVTYRQFTIGMVATGKFVAGEAAAVSLSVRGTWTGSLGFQTVAYSSTWAFLGQTLSPGFPKSEIASRQSSVYASLPANVGIVSSVLSWIDAAGGTLDIGVSAAQLEKSAFATSYIPTTTAAATRNADVMTVPTSRWSAGALTMLAVSGAGRPGTFQGNLVEPSLSADNRMRLSRSSTKTEAVATVGGVSYSAAIVSVGPSVAAGRFSVGSPVSVFASGVRADSPAALSAMPARGVSAPIGGGSVSFAPLGAPIARAVIYASALTDAQIQSAELTTELLNGIDPPTEELAGLWPAPWMVAGSSPLAIYSGSGALQSINAMLGTGGAVRLNSGSALLAAINAMLGESSITVSEGSAALLAINAIFGESPLRLSNLGALGVAKAGYDGWLTDGKTASPAWTEAAKEVPTWTKA